MILPKGEAGSYARWTETLKAIQTIWIHKKFKKRNGW